MLVESLEKYWADGALSNPWSNLQYILKLELIILGLTGL